MAAADWRSGDLHKCLNTGAATMTIDFSNGAIPAICHSGLLLIDSVRVCAGVGLWFYERFYHFLPLLSVLWCRTRSLNLSLSSLCRGLTSKLILLFRCICLLRGLKAVSSYDSSSLRKRQTCVAEDHRVTFSVSFYIFFFSFPIEEKQQRWLDAGWMDARVNEWVLTDAPMHCVVSRIVDK